MKNIRIDITDKEVVENICNIATKVCRLRKGVLKTRTRVQKIHLPRMVVSNISLVEKGIHYNTIAEVLKRHRSSIYYYEKYHEIYYSHWDHYRRIYNKVYNAYTDGKKAQLKEVDLKDLLKDAEIFNRKDPQVFIDVLVGEASTSIKSTYKDFTADVEGIKRALKDYTHDLYINL